ncbi:hypothetical protein ACHAXH_001738 [Discostella pseudostelligera]
MLSLTIKRSLPSLYCAPGNHVRCLSRGHLLTTVTTRRQDVTRGSIKTFAPHGSFMPRQRDALIFQKIFISTTPPRSVVGWIQDKLAERAKTKKAAKLIDQIALMANSPTWTIKMFADEIDETLSSWQTKIPGASRTKEIQTAKETQIVVKGILDHLGEDVTAGDIAKLDRRQKLKLSIACKKPVDEIDAVLQSFRQMEIMHRILRYRKENGIAMPTDEDGLKLAMQQDGLKVMTKEEKQEMKEAYGKYALAAATGKAKK